MLVKHGKLHMLKVVKRKNKEFLINKLMVSDIELLKNNVFLNMEESGSDFLRTSHSSCPDFNKNIKVLLLTYQQWK